MEAETPSQNVDFPYCHRCWKTLPASFRGFDVCPTCLMHLEIRQNASRTRLPSYKSPLQALDEHYARANR